ncbi:MAG: glycine/sarcosine/betaine reductase selenoprotein B family protein, partial [Anaerolineales bacterium]
LTDNPTPETFEEFKNSFSYGTRSDMNYKFLKSLSEEDAGQFFQELLWKLGEASNDGDFEPIIRHIFHWQIKAYTGKPNWEYEDAPFTSMGKPVSKAKIGLLTTSGHFVEGDDPKPFGVQDLSQDEAHSRISEFLKSEPVLSEIPVDIAREKLRVRHGGYDIRAAQADPNTVLPIDRLIELETEGELGQVLGNAYSFVGATAQKRLINESGPLWAEMLKDQWVDGMILVPV